MSSAKRVRRKQLERRRREAFARHARQRFLHEPSPDEYAFLAGSAPSDPNIPCVVQLLEIEITREPMHDPAAEVMSDADRDRLIELGEAVAGGASGRCDELRSLRSRYPDIPKIWNYLAVAYQNEDRWDEMFQLLEETHRRFPDYLFGLTGYCELCMTRGNFAEVERLLGRRLHVRLMYPDRRLFHVSEVLAFEAVVARYLWHQDAMEAALSHLAIMMDLSPDHPQTLQTAALLRRRPLLPRLKRMLRGPAFGRPTAC